jgi:hypothetical protein
VSARPPMNETGGVAGTHPQLQLYRREYLAKEGLRPQSYAQARTMTAGWYVGWMATGAMLLAVIATFTISSAMLTTWKIHYLTAGGNFYEKLHPTTYFAFLAFALLLMRSQGPIGEINRMFSEAKLLLVYLVCWLFLLVQMFVLERPFTVIIDTFLLPVVLCLVIWQFTPSQKRPLVWAVHLTILLNVVLGYYEYFSGHRLFPLTLGDIVVLGEWRSSALLGHPLTASGIVAAYILALVLRPVLCPPAALRLPLIAFCLGSMMAFGGRTALVTVLAVIGLYAGAEAFRLLRGKRTPLSGAIIAICVLFAAGAGIFTALDLGIFDKMLLRFSSDKGSTLARYATFNLLSHFDWHELVLGPNPVRVNALQSQLGLNYGIENFWISCIVQFGIIHTALLTAGLACFFIEVIRRSSRAVWAVILLIVVIAASSVSFSSKNIQLAQFVMLISLLLPRQRRSFAAPTRLAAHRQFRPIPA